MKLKKKLQKKRYVKSNKKKQKWMTDYILDIMEEQRKVKGKDISKYKELGNVINQKWKEKEAWWNKQCDEIEREFDRNPPVAHTRVK